MAGRRAVTFSAIALHTSIMPVIRIVTVDLMRATVYSIKLFCQPQKVTFLNFSVLLIARALK
jgi:hypothetical protein